jgi:hypothetical protein
MSLWFIPDTETVSVMTDFDGRLKAGARKAVMSSFEKWQWVKRRIPL